jgi:hypothetical protein
MKLYIAILNEFPDYMTPTLVAHSMLGAHLHFTQNVDEASRNRYIDWLNTSFKKCVVRVNRTEFMKIAAMQDTYLGHENNTLNGEKSCAIPLPVYYENIPNVLKFAKLWSPLAD